MHISVNIPPNLTVFVETNQNLQSCIVDNLPIITVRSDSKNQEQGTVVDSSDDANKVKNGCYAYFIANREKNRLLFPADKHSFAHSLSLFREQRRLVLYRDAFWQLQGPWLRHNTSIPSSAIYKIAPNGFRHPIRSTYPTGEIYRRYDHDLGVWFSLRTLTSTRDVNVFSEWQNKSRVAEYWEMPGDLDVHRRYLKALGKDAHILPIFGCIGDAPFSYFEVYWAKEDRIAPYCDPEDYDRGIHMLVGDDSHRGPSKVRTWLTSLCHYIFTSEPRTKRIVAEPRSDNVKMISYMQAHRFANVKQFDFPHKRAALLAIEREAYFERCDMS